MRSAPAPALHLIIRYGDNVLTEFFETYLPKFRKVLPEIKVARYYQLENKIDAIVDYALAAQMPSLK